MRPASESPVLGSLLIHANAPPEIISALERFGHKVQATAGALWAPSVIRIDPAGDFDAAGDARSGRHAAAF